jgi:adenylosuccinate synthase
MVKAIVGANWGDEGKGKITDMLAEESDIIVRFQGGSNAGHTIINDYGKFALHILPSGVFYNHTTSVIGNGVALNVRDLVKEINSLVGQGVPQPKILVSDRAQILMPYHILFDQYEEERLGGKSFGSTKSGIAPFYSDKYAKIGFQVNELFDDEAALKEKVYRIMETKNVLIEHLYHKAPIDPEEIFEELLQYREMIRPYVGDVSVFLRDAIKDGKKILLEGQLGSLKDPDFGIYPMVTSSSTLASYGAIGAGIPGYEIKDVVTVVKAYSSAVGAGEFVSEIFGDEADELRRRGGDGGEFGATTGRPRRMGWFDAVASRYGCRMQGATEVALTVLDVLGYLDELPICVGYEIDGEVTRDFPSTPKLKKAKPVYKVLPGWKTEIRGIKKYEDLPENCRNYIEFIEKELEVPITMVSNGPGRHEIIHRQSSLEK